MNYGLYGPLKSAGICIILFCAPVLLAPLFNAPLSKTLTLMTSIFILEYFATSIGVGLGLNPFFVLIVVLSVGAGIIVLMFGIFEFIGATKIVSGLLSKSHKKAQKSKIIQKYGIYGLIPGTALFGFYICPAIAWVTGWRKDTSMLLIIFGFAVASAIVLLSTLGILRFVL